ncbi:hypothetical protein QYE76_061326 [Lolium multiflorum]|uniref:DNA-directed DNA polymerase n=1 Tax=Lolium multiflorum TaxID=4521 RepID=A0AAD8S0H6_LOLMU|nr:hypothetical protein QYE76_061326 [Lolium multiflorum]
MLKCPIHELPGNIIIDNFYARLSFQDKTLLDTSCSGSFTRNKEEFKRDLLNRIQENTEGWENDKDRESGINYDYKCIEAFMDTDKFRNMSATYGLDSQVAANLYKAFASHYELPKKNFDKYHEPYKDKIDSSINKCVVVETVDHVIPEAYIEKTPFPAKMKEYSVINSVVNKSEKKPIEPEEQIKVEPVVAIVKDLVTENVEDGHIIFCEDASNIVSHPNKSRNTSVPMLSVRIGDHCYYGLCDIGASISAIPYALYTEIMHEIRSCELEDIDVVIRLANRETISPIGIVRDVEVLCDCKKEKILTKFAGESYEFNFSKFSKTPYKADSPNNDFRVEQCASIALAPNNPLQQHLENSESEVFREERNELDEIFLHQPILKHDLPVEDLGTTLPPKEDPVFDLKPLPDNLKCAHIDDKKIYHVIISSKLSEIEEESLLEILKKHRGAIGYTLDDLKGISPSICQHAINMEDDAKPVVEHQRRLISKMKDVGIECALIIEKLIRRMPFGLCNAPATFQRCMSAIFHGFCENIVEVFMDDFSVYGNSFDNCLRNLDKVLQRCEETNLVLNWEKCHFMVNEGIVLGHKISERGIEVDRAKVEAIEKMPYPRDVKVVDEAPGIAMDEVRKKLFSISLSGKAAHWYKLLDNGDSLEWNDIVPRFYSKFYPPSEIHKDRNRIYNFWPHDGESIAQAWGRLKSLMLKCPIHELPGNVIIDNFYARLSFEDKTLLDTSCSGSFTRNKEEFKRDLLNRIQENTEGWENDKDRESGINYDYKCIEAFMDTDKFRNMSATYGLDSQVAANLYKAFASHYELPKKNFDKYHEPYKDKIDSSINKCVVVETVDHVIPEAYIEKTPFPAKMKEYSVINSAVHKSENKPIESEEQIKVEPVVAIVKDLAKKASVPMLSVRIGDHCYYGLCDIGASISAIPYELYTEIMHEIGSCELEDIDVVIQLANRETISPIGIVRDVEVLCDLGTTPPPKEDPVFDLKPLPDNLKYAHIDDKKTYPVIISSKLSEFEEERLLEILKKHRGAIGYTLDDLKGISLSICQHAINMEDDASLLLNLSVV